LGALDNIKHITILYTLYSSGLRLDELLNLRVNDISFDRNQIFIRQGKGNKDRVVMLSDLLKRLLIFYTDEYKPVYWLFEGKDKKTQYSPSSVRNIVKLATMKAGITKRVTPHKIRHCFATHLLDGGTDIRYIQELLGHKDIKTTLIYTHVTTKNVTQIKSPLDNLNIKINNI
jgi:site-specific recombinase XerD